jgi:uncharacterized glyoxalase superfamily protein PhnB
MPGPTVIPVLSYPDVRAAVAWLCEAFGFEERLRIGDHRAQLLVGEGVVVLVDATEDWARRGRPSAPRQSVMVRVSDMDEHVERARRHGARILMEPTEFPFGERQYQAEDWAGHLWTFSETVDDIDPAFWGGELVETERE